MFKKLLFLTMLVSLVTFQACSEEEVIASVADCAGTVGGTATEDDCGVCDDDGTNDNTTCADCAGEINGTAVEDACGVCEGDGSSCADCEGTPNGSAVTDCNGDCGGTASVDCSDTCSGGNTGVTPSVEDACGVCGGPATSLDDCLAEGACSLPDDSMYISSTGQLWYNSTQALGGLQFTLQGSTFTDGTSTLLGDAASTDWTVTVGENSGVVLALSFTGTIVPAGCGEMFQLNIADPSAVTGLGGATEFIVSSTSGTAIPFTYYTGE